MVFDLMFTSAISNGKCRFPEPMLKKATAEGSMTLTGYYGNAKLSDPAMKSGKN